MIQQHTTPVTTDHETQHVQGLLRETSRNSVCMTRRRDCEAVPCMAPLISYKLCWLRLGADAIQVLSDDVQHLCETLRPRTGLKSSGCPCITTGQHL